MATIKEVAQMAGVSTATVSRFINKTVVVNTEAADRISEAIETLHYLPNRLARNLRTTRTNYILVLMPSIENSFLSHVIRGIQNVGSRMGYSIIIGITQNNDANERNYLDLVKSRGVDGIISISPVVGVETIKEIYSEYPIIQCSEYCTPDIPYVTIDNQAAAYEITSLLIRRGCRRPAMISSDLSIISFKERERGFLMALEDNGIEVDRSLITYVPLGFNPGKKAAEKLMKLKPDGIFAVGDIIALGAMRYLLDAGYRVPEDILVAGFDGIPRSREFRPSLTTVIQPAFDMGRTAARLIIDLICGREIANRTLLSYRIAQRGSTDVTGATNDIY